MNKHPGTSGVRRPFLAEALPGSHLALLGAVLLLLVLLSFKHYLLFHTLAEVISVVVAVAAFAVAWSAYPFSRNHYLMLVGIVLFWSGVLDLLHALHYRGMNIFQDASANAATQIWIGTRYFQSAGFLAAALFLTRPLHRIRDFAVLGMAATGLYAAIYLGKFPDAYLEGIGLTAFKVASEYVVIALFAAGLAVLWARRALVDRTMLELVTGAMGMLIAAELAFTFYVDVYGLSNLVGHLLKVGGYWLLYWALVGFTIEQPFRIMARTASTYDAVPEAIMVIDRSGVVREANRAALSSAPDAVGRDAHEASHPGDIAREVCPICRALASGESFPVLDLQAGERWYEFTLSPVRREHAVSGMVQTRRDVTERRRAAQLIVENERRLRALTENLTDTIVVLDGAGEVRFASASVKQMGGYRPEDVLGRNFIDFVHPDDVARAQADLVRLLRDPDRPIEAELRCRRRDGSWMVLEVISKNALADPAVRGIVVNARDVTRRKEDDQRLREQLDELRRFQRVSVGRELRMQELEAEIRRLEMAVAAEKAMP